jgi:hypothetical protein
MFLLGILRCSSVESHEEEEEEMPFTTSASELSMSLNVLVPNNLSAAEWKRGTGSGIQGHHFF